MMTSRGACLKGYCDWIRVYVCHCVRASLSVLVLPLQPRRLDFRGRYIKLINVKLCMVVITVHTTFALI